MTTSLMFLLLITIAAPVFIGSLIINIIHFLFHRLNVFEIQYAGGKIAFDSNWYDKSEVDDFQRQLLLAKDSAISNSEPLGQIAQLFQKTTSSASSSSTADELKKFADLLSQGIISQEEFEQAKADLLSRRG